MQEFASLYGDSSAAGAHPPRPTTTVTHASTGIRPFSDIGELSAEQEHVRKQLREAEAGNGRKQERGILRREAIGDVQPLGPAGPTRLIVGPSVGEKRPQQQSSPLADVDYFNQRVLKWSVVDLGKC